MTKQEIIKYWIDTSEKDWKVVGHLFKSKDYVHCLFFAHLVLEKLAKAVWVKNSKESQVPKIHNLVFILDNAKVEIPDEMKDFLFQMNDFQIEGRYPDYTQAAYKLCDKNKTKGILTKVRQCRQWLQEKLR